MVVHSGITSLELSWRVEEMEIEGRLEAGAETAGIDVTGMLVEASSKAGTIS